MPRWGEWMRHNAFREAALAPLTPDQVRLLVNRWHDAVHQLLAPREPERAAEVATLAPALIRLLDQRPALRGLAENPLLCAMTCAVHREYRDQLASQRLQLYTQCVAMLLHGRDTRRKVPVESPIARLTPDQKRLALGRFALWLLNQGLTEVDAAQADREFFDVQAPLLRQPNLSGAELRRFYVERAGLLQAPAADRVEYAHRTFQEYLAAGVIATESNTSALRKHAADETWRELIILAMGQVPQPTAEKFLAWLLVQAERRPKQARTFHLLALACLETIPALDPLLQSRIEDQARAYLPPEDDDSARLLARAGDPLVPLLADPPENPTAAAACVTALGQIGTAAALQVLRQYAASEDLRVSYALGRAWPHFDRAEFARAIWHDRTDIVLPSIDYLDILPLLPPRIALTALATTDLTPLAGLSQLQFLYLRDPQVTSTAIRRLQAANPNLLINYW